MEEKIIHDPLHGSIKVGGVFLETLSRHEVQRLRNIKQLGLASYVFPGANHTRMEHSLGVFHLSERMCTALEMDEEDKSHVKMAAMLHDVCHLPFSHNLAELFENMTGKDHMELARDLINGTIPTFLDRDSDVFDGKETLSELMESHGISSDFVCDLISNPKSRTDGLDAFMSGGNKQSFFSSKDYLHQIIHGPVDADQMDYLMRDAHYTGVAHGMIDIDRLLNQLRKHNNTIVLDKGGIVAAEGLMVSRALMYSSVYFNKTVRIVEMMMSKAVELSSIGMGSMHLVDDCDLRTNLIEEGGEPSSIMRSILRRDLYKKAFSAYTVDLEEDQISRIAEYSRYDDKKRLEMEIADEAGVKFSEVIVDIPSHSALVSSAKIGKTDVSILYEGKVRTITKLSPIARALQSRGVYDWAVMISTPSKNIENVKFAAEKILSL